MTRASTSLSPRRSFRRLTATQPGDVAVIRREGRAFVELLAAWGFAIARPLLDVFGRTPEHFAFRAAQPATIIARAGRDTRRADRALAG